MTFKKNKQELIINPKRLVKDSESSAKRLTHDWKLKKLEACVLSFIPNGSEETIVLEPNAAAVVVKAIQEMNKIQGSYPPPKKGLSELDDLSNDPHLRNASIRLREILVQYEKDY